LAGAGVASIDAEIDAHRLAESTLTGAEAQAWR
jgi:hypothetical protein